MQAILTFASSAVVEPSGFIARRLLCVAQNKNPRVRRVTRFEGYTARFEMADRPLARAASGPRAPQVIPKTPVESTATDAKISGRYCSTDELERVAVGASRTPSPPSVSCALM